MLYKTNLYSRAVAEKHLRIEDVAQAAGIRPATVSAYVNRSQMPAPSRCPTCGNGSVWPGTVIAEWLRRRAARGTTPTRSGDAA